MQRKTLQALVSILHIYKKEANMRALLMLLALFTSDADAKKRKKGRNLVTVRFGHVARYEKARRVPALEGNIIGINQLTNYRVSYANGSGSMLTHKA